MGHDVDHALFHQRAETDRGPAVIRENQEGAAVGYDPAVQRQAVHGRGHAVLADPVMDVRAGVITGLDHTLAVLGACVVGACQVGRAADELRHDRGQRLDYLLGGNPRCDLLPGLAGRFLEGVEGLLE